MADEHENTPDDGGPVTAARDRAVGALLGLACGDAVGTTLEFKAPGSFDPIDDMVGGGPFSLRPGEWTDDTSMALCLAESVLDRGALDPADQMHRYLRSRTDGYLSSNGRCFDIGTTVSSQLARFARSGEPIATDVDEEAAANGSLMRLAAVPIRWHADPAVAAERSGESSRPTHPARRPVDSCRVLGAMTSALIAGQPADEVLAAGFWRFGDLHPQVAAVAAGSWRGKDASQVRGTGFCVDALEAAIWAVEGAADYRDAILRAANLGDDADTTAAIAGQLAGARWGASGIPAEWRSKVVLRDRIEAIAGRLFDAGRAAEPTGKAGGTNETGEPAGTSETRGTEDTGSASGAAPMPASAGGISDEAVASARWQHDASLHAWWVEPGAVLAGEYPGDRQRHLAAQKVNLLVDHGVRSFVDLTDADDGLAPYAAVIDEVAAARGLDLRRHHVPIPDLGVVEADMYDTTVATIREEEQRGVVYIHCWGGVGRTGTVVGCLLVDAGLAPDDVGARLADLRIGTRKADRPCPETDAQLAVVAGRRHGGRVSAP